MTDQIFTRDVFRCININHSRHFLCCRSVNGQNSCSWIFASQNRTITHPIHIIIIRIFSVTEHFFFHIKSMHSEAKLPVIGCFFRNFRIAHNLRCQFHSSNDFYITGATTVIISQGIFNLIFRRIRIFVQQCLGTHHHSRNTESTLYRSGFSVSISKYFRLPFGETFCCYNFFPFQSVCSRNTGLAGLSIYNDCTRSTSTLTASVFYRCKLQLISEKPKQRLLLFCRDHLSVYIKCIHSIPTFFLFQSGDCRNILTKIRCFYSSIFRHKSSPHIDFFCPSGEFQTFQRRTGC